MLLSLSFRKCVVERVSRIRNREAFLQTSDEVLHPRLIGMCGEMVLPFCNAQRSDWAAGPGDIIEGLLSIGRLGVRAGIRACCTRARVHTAAMCNSFLS